MGNAQQSSAGEGSDDYTLVRSLRDAQAAKAGRKLSDWAARYVCFSADRTELLLYRETADSKELKKRVELDAASTHIRPMIGKFELQEFCIAFETNCSTSKVQCVLAFSSKKMYLRWVRALLDAQHRIATAHLEGFTMLNGSKYYGQRQGVCRQGSGSVTTPSGAVNCGSWEEDVMAKHARVEYSPVLLYDGCVERGAPHGIGRVSSSNQVAVGHWEEGAVKHRTLLAVDRGTGRFCGFGVSRQIINDQSIFSTAGLWSVTLQCESETIDVTTVADRTQADGTNGRPLAGTVRVKGDHSLPYTAFAGPLLRGLPHGRGWAKLMCRSDDSLRQNAMTNMDAITPLREQVRQELNTSQGVQFAHFQHGQLVPHASIFLAALRAAYGDEARLQAIQKWVESAQAQLQAPPLCLLCQQAPADALFDCSHCVVCWECANDDKQCPVCQQQSVTALRTFYS